MDASDRTLTDTRALLIVVSAVAPWSQISFGEFNLTSLFISELSTFGSIFINGGVSFLNSNVSSSTLFIVYYFPNQIHQLNQCHCRVIKTKLDQWIICWINISYMYTLICLCKKLYFSLIWASIDRKLSFSRFIFSSSFCNIANFDQIYQTTEFISNKHHHTHRLFTILKNDIRVAKECLNWIEYVRMSLSIPYEHLGFSYLLY